MLSTTNDMAHTTNACAKSIACMFCAASSLSSTAFGPFSALAKMRNGGRLRRYSRPTPWLACCIPSKARSRKSLTLTALQCYSESETVQTQQNAFLRFFLWWFMPFYYFMRFFLNASWDAWCSRCNNPQVRCFTAHVPHVQGAAGADQRSDEIWRKGY